MSPEASPEATVPSSTDPADSRVMRCMEVFGGNEAVDVRLSVPGLEAAIYASPLGGVRGGDVHYLSSCATGRIARILLADVAGHGPHVATIAEALRDRMRRFVNYVTNEGLMAALNRACVDHSEDARFASAIVATYWAPTDRLILANAGHPRPLWYRARRGTWSFVDTRDARPQGGPANIPLGVVDDVRYDALTLRLRPGDVVVLYTDAFLEAARPDGSRLGEEGLLRLVKSLEPDRIAETPRILAAAVEEWSGDVSVDDATIFALRHVGGRSSTRSVAKATGDFARAALDALRGRGPFPWPEFGVANLLGAVVSPLNRLVGRDALDP